METLAYFCPPSSLRAAQLSNETGPRHLTTLCRRGELSCAARAGCNGLVKAILARCLRYPDGPVGQDRGAVRQVVGRRGVRWVRQGHWASLQHGASSPELGGVDELRRRVYASLSRRFRIVAMPSRTIVATTMSMMGVALGVLTLRALPVVPVWTVNPS